MSRKKARSIQSSKNKPPEKIISAAYQSKSILFWFLFSAMFLYCCWNVFRGLAAAPLFDWDEARHGINAWEMIKNRNYLVHTYLGEADYWNLKPPLAFWPIVLGYRLFGLNAFGLRFFSALSLPFCCAGAMLFIYRYSGRAEALCTGFLFASTGVQFNHLFLHGDADAVFFLFCFLSLLFFCLAYSGHTIFLIGTGLTAAGAFLAKAAHAGILLIVLLVAAIILYRVKSFSIKDLILFFLLPMAAPVLLWSYCRWRADGFSFIEKMLFTDVLARTSSELDGNARGATYYINEFIRTLGPLLFFCFCIVTTICIVLLFVNRKRMSNWDRVVISVYCMMVIVPIGLYTLAVTKLSWYVWPSYIGFILLTGWLIGYLLRGYRQGNKKSGYASVYLGTIIIIGCMFLLGIGAMPDRMIMQKYFDTSTVLPKKCIFFYVPENMTLPPQYIAISPDRNPVNLPQSWVLQGVFNGYSQVYDSLDNDSATNFFAVVRYTSAKDLESFLQSSPDYSLIASNSNYAIVALSKNDLL